MPITRTPIIDDDGSGRTGTIYNNAWKQELYGQIDALAGMVPTAWTPTDGSGAGLTLPPGATYVRIGNVVSIAINIVFPTTANSAPAKISGLPFVAATASGLYTVYGISRVYHIQGNGTSIIVFNPTTGGQFANADLSGSTIAIGGTYQV